MDLASITLTELTQFIRQGITDEIKKEAAALRQRHYGKSVYIRGLIEVSNYCVKGCYYCGISRNNKQVERYRLTKEQILQCCRDGYELGFKTFVLQSGEDPYYDGKPMADIIAAIKEGYPNCAVTLSLGEKSTALYKEYYKAGADRYLLRHETSNNAHYQQLHPKNHSLKERMACLYTLKEIGYQIGAGFMVGSPYQKPEYLAEDLLFLRELEPHMIGIGPFIPQSQTPFKDKPPGSLSQTLFLLALTRLLLPEALMPATTALGSLHPTGREQGISHGCNVVMPNLSPAENRKKYALYDNKAASASEAAEGLKELKARIRSIGYEPDMGRGDVKNFSRKKA